MKNLVSLNIEGMSKLDIILGWLFSGVVVASSIIVCLYLMFA